jgi:hypothetical protein
MAYDNDVIPLRNVPIAIDVDGVEVRGTIHALYPNDVTVIMTSPVAGLSSGTHIPYFAMPARAVGILDGRRTKGLTGYGKQCVEQLLRRCYEYSQGKTDLWQVRELGPSDWM